MEPTVRQQAVGVTIFMAVACIWVFSAELIQHILKEEDFPSPYFLTYYSVSLFSVCLTGFLRRSWRATFEPPAACLPLADPTSEASTTTPSPFIPPARRALRAAVVLAPLFFFSNYSFNVGLRFTSVGSATTIASLTTLFTLIFGVAIGIEIFSFAKLIATVLVIIGVAIISFKDKRLAGKDNLVGDLISILSAAIYAVYAIALKQFSGHDENFPMIIMLSFMGLFTAVTMWPGFFVLDAFRWEPFHFPSRTAFTMLTVNGLVGTVVSDFLWAKGVVLTTPVIATLSLSLSVPLSIITDLLMGHESFDLVYLMGASLVLVGFVMVNLEEYSRRHHTDDVATIPRMDEAEEPIVLHEHVSSVR